MIKILKNNTLIPIEGPIVDYYSKSEVDNKDSLRLNPDNIVVKTGDQFSIDGRSETLNGTPCIFYDTKGTLIKAEITISLRTAAAANAGVYRWGLFFYNGNQINPYYGWYGGAYTENITGAVSIAWNSGNSGIYVGYHGQLAASKLIMFTAQLWFNRANLVSAGILS